MSVGLAAQVSNDAAPSGDREVYLAKDDGDGKAGDPVLAFSTTDIPIHCVVVLGSNQSVTVKMNFVAVSVPGVKAETRVVSSSYTTNGVEDRVNFTGRPYKLWVAGLYRVDIMIGSEPKRSVEFKIVDANAEVKGNRFAAPAKKPKSARKN
jgi:hypothetical protein